MTNDQKLVFLIHQVEEYFRAQEKAENTGAIIHREEARRQKHALKVWLAGNRVVATNAPAVRQKSSFTSSQARMNWLGK